MTNTILITLLFATIIVLQYVHNQGVQNILTILSQGSQTEDFKKIKQTNQGILVCGVLIIAIIVLSLIRYTA